MKMAWCSFVTSLVTWVSVTLEFDIQNSCLYTSCKYNCSYQTLKKNVYQIVFSGFINFIRFYAQILSCWVLKSRLSIAFWNKKCHPDQQTFPFIFWRAIRLIWEYMQFDSTCNCINLTIGYAVQCTNVAHHLWTQYRCFAAHLWDCEEQVTVYILILSSKTVPHDTYTSANDL